MIEAKSKLGRPRRAQKTSTVRINFRATIDEAKELKLRAEKKHDGDVSAYCRAKTLGEKKNGS